MIWLSVSSRYTATSGSPTVVASSSSHSRSNRSCRLRTDRLHDTRSGRPRAERRWESRTARSITQMAHDVLTGHGITLVNGGEQQRSFTYISDGIAALLAILRDERASDGRIFNIGNPANNASIKELAGIIIEVMKEIPAFREAAEGATVTVMPAEKYYGNGYDDMQNRVPSIEAIGEALGWKPVVPLREAVARTIASYPQARR